MTTAPLSHGPVGIGVIGAGMISDTYLDNLTRFPDVRVVHVGDLDPERARQRAEQHGVPRFGTPDDVLAEPEVELVVNLTIPAAHAAVSSAALTAGKHVWSEKPIGIERESAKALIEQADAAGLLLGVAPDTVLGPAFQTARRVIESGAIGDLMAAQTVLQYAGPDLFHPSPEFLFAPGGGPVFDVGPYILTELVLLFGPVVRVSAVAPPARPQRTILVGDRAGETFPVGVPTHVSALLEFASGAVSQTLLSFETPVSRQGIFEVHGTTASLQLGDHNLFTDNVLISQAVTASSKLRDQPVWDEIAPQGVDVGRGVGALDMARAIRAGGQPLASGRLAYHVLDIMASIDDAIREHRTVELTSATDPVPVLPEDFDPYASTLG
ncbi:Gfo/Idh/MocA family protein [Aestuariimicrobium ganziense]|uniref:Gfo/Idh/MocA family protein n=1 Tax=Aestuariimicrobium ganziense TaxID=2773677 RepID=UPI00194553C5|nr:Gfo/Idh/MocA family oxidoreductase [Aestuariimicrobium ganziense]